MSNQYNAAELDKRLRAALRGNPIYMIVTGESGTGKSTLVASIPVPQGKDRLILDSEDGMNFLDAGPEGEDLYTPRIHRFRMRRRRMAGADDLRLLYSTLWDGKHREKIGAIGIDNIFLMQSTLISHLLELAQKPDEFRKFLAVFNKPLPMTAFGNKIITKARENWQNMGRDQTIYQALKNVLGNLLLTCRQHNIHFIGATEQGALWKDYGTANQEKVGDKPKVLDPFLKYCDFSVRLVRGVEEINENRPPLGMIMPAQPKVRVQGLNPKWTMDWPGFVDELEKAAKRRNEPVPEEAKIKNEIIVMGSGDETSLPPEKPKA